MDPDKIPKTWRYYVRYSASTPSFELEVIEGSNVARFAGYFLEFFNPATGFPFPLDLIDNAVGLPRGSTTAFVQEAEARLIQDPEIEDKKLISDYFSYLNPQKEEYI